MVDTNKLKPVMQLMNGHFIDFANPENSVYDIEDIALGLSRESRSNGHTSEMYTVAQHCVMVSYIVPEHLALDGLLHDAVEGFMKDINKPLKVMIPAYSEIEHKLEADMAKRFGIQFPFDKEIKLADTIAFVTERRDLSPTTKLDRMYRNVKPLEEVIKPWGSKVAYKKFLKRYYELTKEKK